jgi:hypothetical protein
MGEAVAGRKVGGLTPMTTRADLLLKANRTIDLHARCVHMYEAGRYVGRPVTDTLTSALFSERYGWHAERMAQDVETAMKHGCAYCGAAYASQADVSFDVIDQAIAWDYSTNVVLCCRRCNSSKGEHSVARWIADRPVLSWAVVDLRRQFAGGDLVEQLSLFDRGLAGA